MARLVAAVLRGLWLLRLVCKPHAQIHSTRSYALSEASSPCLDAEQHLAPVRNKLRPTQDLLIQNPQFNEILQVVGAHIKFKKHRSTCYLRPFCPGIQLILRLHDSSMNVCRGWGGDEGARLGMEKRVWFTSNPWLNSSFPHPLAPKTYWVK